MSWCGARTRRAAAASSIASGMPSSRRQIVAARAAFVGVASISGRLTRARARNSSTAGFRVSTSGSVSSSAGTGRGSTQTTRSRGTPIAIRLVARIVRPGRPGEEVGEGRRGGPHVLDGVEDEDARLAAQGLGEGLDDRPAGLFRDAHGAGDRGQDERRVVDAVEGHERDAAVAPRQRAAGELDGEPALPHPADPGERDERPVAAQGEPADGRDVGLAPDQRRVRNVGDRTGPARVDAVRRGGDAAGAGCARSTSGRLGISRRGRRVPSIRREPEAHVAGQDAPVAEARHGPQARRLAREQARQEQVGGRRLRVRAARREPQDGGLAHAAQPQHRARVGRHAATDEAPATPSSATKNGSEGSVERPPAVSTTSTASAAAPARHRSERRFDGRRLVGQVVEAHDRRAERLHLVPDAALEPRAIGGPQRLLDQHADPHRHERRHRDQRPSPARGDRHAPLDDGRRHDVRGDLHRGDQLARRHDGPVERREHLERIDPVEQLHLARADVEHARVRRDEVDAALVGTALLEARATHRGGEAEGRLVLVEVAGLHDEHRDGVDPELRRVGGGEGREVVGPRAVGPSPTGRHRRAGRAPARRRSGQPTGGGPARFARAARLRSGPPTPAQPTRASAAWIARRV